MDARVCVRACVCVREREVERERNVIFEWLIKKRNRWEQSVEPPGCEGGVRRHGTGSQGDCRPFNNTGALTGFNHGDSK